jgi:opine dehydrogenase
MKISVIGNTSRNIGVASAADFALSGHDVAFAVFPEQAAQIEAAKANGELLVEGEPSNLIAGQVGPSKPRSIGADPPAALKGADIVVLDIPMLQLESRFSDLIPHLEAGAVVHVQSYGCWAAPLLMRQLANAGRNDAIVTEARAPTTMAKFSGHTVTPVTLRRGLQVASMSKSQTEKALARLRQIFPDMTAAESILQTSLENINLMIHPAMSLLGVAMFEQAERKGDKIAFYRDANTPSGGLLGDALDRERAGVCAAYGVRHQSLVDSLKATYGAQGSNAYEAVLNCKPYQRTADMDPRIWRDWLVEDVPFGMSPLVLLGEQAGVPVRLHRAMVEIFGAILGIDPWAGPSLAKLQLEGKPADVIARSRH